MDGEAKRLIQVWILAITSLCYCYYIASRLPKGILRLLSLFPIFYLFTILPLELNSFHLCGITSFFLTWLATFNLLLFCFDQGPLSPLPPNVLHFISLASFPIKFQKNTDPTSARNSQLNEHYSKVHKTPRSSPRIERSRNPSINFIYKSFLLSIKVALLVTIFYSYNYRQFMHPYVVLILYCLHLYFELEIVLAIFRVPVQVLFGFELEPQFNEPYLATSLQDFWGRRWNLVVTNILRPTVYHPVRRVVMHLIGPKWASLPATIATFAVSGVAHEIIYFYLTRANPTFEVTSFFILHGVCVSIEIILKKLVNGKWRLHPMVSRMLTVIFVVVTGGWLFFPQITRNGVDDKIVRECFIILEFVKHKLSTLSFIGIK